MPNPIRPDLGTILTNMRDTGLEWLAEAADTIEQAIVGQTYEYAVQEDIGEQWAYLYEYADRAALEADPNYRGPTMTWFPTYERAALIVEEEEEYFTRPLRIVRRTVGEIEVVE